MAGKLQISAEVKPAQRTCLGCGKLFNSAGPGNRRCLRCVRKDKEGRGIYVSKLEQNQARDTRK